ncbi:glycosyltransferase family 4 protein [Aquisalimonas sp. 2447]|uniref:glycosyltransferase family 4 protein n=1 Tax=Aquisalimonas sp. 2447 TaxID=2740807 RepID=UPI0020C264D2|nr:glycosyltransferase family 4 protein [Aquisalimonas sp. 2447]
MSSQLHVFVPGSLSRRTGGTIYDARMISALRDRGENVVVHELDGTFPAADATARRALAASLEAVPDGAVTILDGLALGDSPELVEPHRERLCLLALVHHPLADEHGLDAGLQRRFLEHERRALAACHGVIVTSAFTGRRVAQLGVPAARVRVAEPGTDPAAPATGPGPDAPPELLCVASLTPRKGQDVLVGALARLQDLPWHASLVGATDADPAFARRVQQQVAEAGLEQRIHLTGACDGTVLANLYRHATLFVLPSRYEGYGMVLTEALACGLPVISTTGGAIPDTVPDGAARLVPPGDADTLAEALDHWLRDPRARAEAAAAAGTHAASLPDWPQAAMLLAEAINELALQDTN